MHLVKHLVDIKQHIEDQRMKLLNDSTIGGWCFRPFDRILGRKLFVVEGDI